MSFEKDWGTLQKHTHTRANAHIHNWIDGKEIISIFFDDNIMFDDPYIIDVRDLNLKNGNECLSFEYFKNYKKYQQTLIMHKAEPLHIIENDDYFIHHFNNYVLK